MALSRRPSDGGRGPGAPPVPVSRLKDGRFYGYLRHPLPHERDTIVDAVVTSYVKAAGPVRQRAIDDLDISSGWLSSGTGLRIGRQRNALRVKTARARVARAGRIKGVKRL